MKILHILALVALSLVSSAALARPPMETNQLVDDTGTPFGTVANPLVTSGGGGGTVTQGTSPWTVAGPNAAGATITGAPVLVAGTDGTIVRTIATTPSGAVYISGAVSVTGGPVNVSATTTAGPVPVFTVGGTSLVGKASAANLYGFSVTASGTAAFLALLNATAAPTAGGAIAPLECVPVPVNGYVARRQDIPDRYTNGLVAVVTSSCTTYTAVAPQVVSLIVQ